MGNRLPTYRRDDYRKFYLYLHYLNVIFYPLAAKFPNRPLKAKKTKLMEQDSGTDKLKHLIIGLLWHDRHADFFRNTLIYYETRWFISKNIELLRKISYYYETHRIIINCTKLLGSKPNIINTANYYELRWISMKHTEL